MKWAVVISALGFTAGNIYVTEKGGDWKYFYIPLAAMIWFMVVYIQSLEKGWPFRIFMDTVFLLSSGYLVKQVFYDYEHFRKQNDYIWGGLIGITLVVELIIWAIRSKRLGKN